MSVINTFSKTHNICVPSAAFSLDTEQPDYDLDSEDDTFVNKLNKKMQITALQFEEMIDRLEKGSGQQVLVSLHMHTGRSSAAIISSYKNCHGNTVNRTQNKFCFNMIMQPAKFKPT